MAEEKFTPELPVLDKKNYDGVTSEVSKFTSSSHGERIVTRKELWSYYRKFGRCLLVVSAVLLTVHPQYTGMAVLCVPTTFRPNQQRILKDFDDR
jgi:hypothetical protein